MDLAEYQSAVGQLSYGKRLPTAIYVFREASSDFGPQINQLVAKLATGHELGDVFNVIKFRTNELKVSFLSYPNFIADAHPALRHAVTIDLVTGRARHVDYTDNLNPPILHRKETFVPVDYPSRGKFATLTKAEESEGLYADTATIGFKLNWERLLADKKLVIRGHKLQRKETVALQESLPEPVIERHKTALKRYELSKPVKSLLEYGLLKPATTFFDYGCGQGSDVRGLRSLGRAAEGWDPVHLPDGAKHEADVVNLGYVLNVIEDPAERLEALVDAFGYARRLLVVSALINETVETGQAPHYRDGVVTQRNTFQKYFDQAGGKIVCGPETNAHS